MRSIRLALLLAVALAPALAAARAWKGIMPGATTQAEVTEKFGEPTTKTKRTGRSVLAYYGEQALDGTRQAQFLDDDALRVDVELRLPRPVQRLLAVIREDRPAGALRLGGGLAELLRHLGLGGRAGRDPLPGAGRSERRREREGEQKSEADRAHEALYSAHRDPPARPRAPRRPRRPRRPRAGAGGVRRGQHRG